MATKNHKVDIFKVLGNLNKNNSTFYDNLTNEEQKAIQPLVVMRWMSGSSDARQIYFLNELVNPFVFSLTHHKKLLVNLLSICGSGNFKRFKWIKSASKKTSKISISVEVVKRYFNYSTKEAHNASLALSSEVILDFAGQLGYQPDEMKALKKELSER